LLCLAFAVWAGGDAVYWHNLAVKSTISSVFNPVSDLAKQTTANPKSDITNDANNTIGDAAWAQADAAIAQALAAVVTLAVIIIQSIIFARQAKTNSDQATLMKTQTDISRHQANIAHDQKTISHQMYLADNRPRLRIRNVVVYRTRNGQRDEKALLFADQEIVGQCFVSNIGGVEAKIVEAHLIVVANQMGLPMERPYEGDLPNRQMGGVVIKEGQSRPIPFREQNPLVTLTGEPDRARSGEFPLFIMGWITYTGHTDAIRRTSFCQRWDARKRRFVRVDDYPDYEHEE